MPYLEIRLEGRFVRILITALLSMSVVAGVYAAPGSVGAYTDVALDDPVNKFDIFVADQISYDSNLYRLPANAAQLGLTPVAARSDEINLASLGVEGQWITGLQSLQFSAHADDNRFDRNKDLNNTSGGARLLLDWRVGSAFAGDAGIDYSRYLAGFASTGFLGRDLVGRADYFADARYQIGPRWSVFGGIEGADTTNTAAAVQGNDGRTTSGKGGVELATSANDAFGLEYRYVDGHYTQSQAFLNGLLFSRDYQDNSARGYLKYVLTQKTSLDGSVGYLKRTYLDSSVGAFAGNIWSFSLQWQATEKTQVTLLASRDLQAYLDALSNYFVSQGFTLSSTWIPTEKITLKSTVGWHDQNYIGSSPVAIALGPRHDKVDSQQVDLIYAATHNLDLDFACRHEERESNQEIFKYNDTLVTASVKYRFL